MQKKLLISLLEKIKNQSQIINELRSLSGSENFTSLLSLTDEQMNDVVNTKEYRPDLCFAKIYLYLKQEILPLPVKDFLEQLIKESNSNILAVIHAERIFSNENVLDFLNIIAHAKGIEQAEYASIAACNIDLQQKDNAIEFVKVISKAEKDYQSKLAMFVACNSNVLQKKNAIDFVEVVSKAKENYQVGYAKDVACNINVLEKDNAIDFVKIIATAEEDYQALYASEVACNSNVLQKKNAIDFVEIVSKAKGREQSLNAYDVACDTDVLQKKNAIDFVKIIATAEEGYQALYARIVACNEDILNREDALEFVNLASQAEKAFQSKCVCVASTHPKTNTIEFVKLASQVQKDYQAELIIDLIILKKLEYRRIKRYTNYILSAKNEKHARKLFEKAFEKKEVVPITEVMSFSQLDETIKALTSTQDAEINENTKVKIKKLR